MTAAHLPFAVVNRCVRCSARLARGAAFCASCGHAIGGVHAAALLVETDGHAGSDGGHEVVLAPTRSPRRWLAGGLVAALAAAIAVSVGAGGGGRSTAPTTTARPKAGTTTSSSTSSASSPVTSSPATTAAPLVGPVLGDKTGLGLLVWAADGVFRLDLDTGAIERTRLRPLDGNPDLTSVGIVFHDVDTNRRRLLTPGAGEPVTISTTPGRYLGEGPPGRLWFADYEPTSDGPSIWYQELGRTRIDVTVPAGAQDVRIDGLGGLVLQAPGGIYVQAAPGETPRRLSAGQLIWVGDGLVLEAACDDVLRCGPRLHDLRTGTARDAPRGFREGAFAFSSASPDGQQLLTVRAGVSDFYELATVDLAGRTTALGPTRSPCFSADCDGRPVWSPDGRWLFWVSGDDVVSAWRAGLAAPIAVSLASRSPPTDRTALTLALVVDDAERLRAFG